MRSLVVIILVSNTGMTKATQTQMLEQILSPFESVNLRKASALCFGIVINRVQLSHV